MTNATAIEKQTNRTDLMFGEKGEIYALANRIKVMVPGGQKLSDNEAMALAQVSTVTKLNPFIGEIWYIPGKGPMIGIKGARRLDQESTAKKGGYSFPRFTVCPPAEAGANEAQVKDCAYAFKCEIEDSASTLAFQKMFTEILASLRESGCTDPVGEARQILGSRPVWTGYGFSTRSEESRMNKVQLAQKRAESNALGRRLVLPFGVEVSAAESVHEYVDVKAVDVTTIVQQNENPDPVTDDTWTRWLTTAKRADKAGIPHSEIKRDAVINDDLVAYIQEVSGFIQEAERQSA